MRAVLQRSLGLSLSQMACHIMIGLWWHIAPFITAYHQKVYIVVPNGFIMYEVSVLFYLPLELFVEQPLPHNVSLPLRASCRGHRLEAVALAVRPLPRLPGAGGRGKYLFTVWADMHICHLGFTHLSLCLLMMYGRDECEWICSFCPCCIVHW